MKRALLLISFLAAGAIQLLAQQDPHYSQYMFNGLVLNPAYAGSREQVSINALYRRQWAGLDGAPTTQSLSVHGPSRNLRHGFGLSLFNDAIGATRQMNVSATYAFRIAMGEKAHLALGLQGSLLNYRADFASIKLKDPNDPAYTNENINLLLPNAGAGIYFNTQSFYAGVSVPHLFNHNLTDDASDAVQSLHVQGTAGVILKVSDQVKFKPSTMIKYVPGAPVTLDLNANFLFADRFWLGAGYRRGESVVGMVEWWITKQLRLGYAYDYLLNDLNKVSNGSHEIMLGFDFSFDKRKMVSPRYF
jgi:type IX secretion system PorP/SprF family membrane protein